MTVQLFIELLAIISVLTGLVVEAEKKIAEELKANYSANLMALITALVIGAVGMTVYYVLTGIPFTVENVICIVLMGFASGLSAMVGYDKIAKGIFEQLNR